MTIPPLPEHPDPVDLAAVRGQVWCAAAVAPIGRWLARGGTGPDGGAGSVAVPVGDAADVGGPDDGAIAALIERAESWYRARGERPAFELPAGDAGRTMGEQLHHRGYVVDPARSATLHSVPIRTLRAAAPAPRDGRVRIAAAPGEEWLECWATAGPGAAHPVPGAGAPTGGDPWDLPGRCAFASQVADGRVVAVGLGVVDGSLLGLYALATDPERRRRGSARRLVGALAIWATANAARSAYTAVPDDDPAVAALVGGLGFVPLARTVVLVAAG